MLLIINKLLRLINPGKAIILFDNFVFTNSTYMNPDLLQGLKDNDSFCFQEIYNLYSYKVYTFVSKYTEQSADAEDITQNVFIHLWKYRKNIDVNVELDAILFKTSRQEISKWYAKQKKLFLVDEELIKSKMNIAEEADENKGIFHERVELLLNNIPEKRKKIFLLHKFEHKSIKDIAIEMNMTPGAVANQISKTLQFLRKELVKYPELCWALLFWLE